MKALSRVHRLFLASVLGLCTVSAAVAQSWPSKPIKVVVNFPPGARPTRSRVSLVSPCRRAWGSPSWWKTAPGPMAIWVARWWPSPLRMATPC